MFEIRWQKYSESEIQEVLSTLFTERGYRVYNIHKTDRRGEAGVDLECGRPAESGGILISVKKVPEQKDIYQLTLLGNRPGSTRIYVYIDEPPVSFKEAMEKLRDEISFWDSRKLTREIFETDLRLYSWLTIESSAHENFYNIVQAFCKIYMSLKKRRPKQCVPVKAGDQMINLLWQAKDRSVSLNKSLTTLQMFFERASLFVAEQHEKESITDGFLRSLLWLFEDTLKPLKPLFMEFIRRYKPNFQKFCLDTQDSSNWNYFLGNIASPYAPGRISETLDKSHAQGSEAESIKEGICTVFADISRFLSQEGYWLEDAVNDLLSIGLTGESDLLRENVDINKYEWK